MNMLDLQERAVEMLKAMSESDRKALVEAIEQGISCFEDIVPKVYQEDFEATLRDLLGIKQ